MTKRVIPLTQPSYEGNVSRELLDFFSGFSIVFPTPSIENAPPLGFLFFKLLSIVRYVCNHQLMANPGADGMFSFCADITIAKSDWLFKKTSASIGQPNFLSDVLSPNYLLGKKNSSNFAFFHL